MTNKGYAAIFEKTRTGYGAHIPDLPGCVAGGRTLRHARRLLSSAIAIHLEGMREDGDVIPEATTVVEHIRPHTNQQM